MLERRIWINSGVVEVIDARQSRLLQLVHDKIIYYYESLYGTERRYMYPLSIAKLKKLCNRNYPAVVSAVRMLANTVPKGSKGKPPIYYDRIQSEKHKAKRPYRIFLNKEGWV